MYEFVLLLVVVVVIAIAVVIGVVFLFRLLWKGAPFLLRVIIVPSIVGIFVSVGIFVVTGEEELAAAGGLSALITGALLGFS